MINFDWSVTNRKLCIFIPNFKRAEYILRNLSCFTTDLADNQWCVVVGNDGIDGAYKYSNHPNIFHFTIDNLSSRNGCLLRNYAIENCQSEWFIQKDPEIYWLSNVDFLKIIVDEMLDNIIFRADSICMMSEDETLKFFKKEPCYLNIDSIDATKYFHIHHLFGTKTSLLKKIGGYDSRFYDFYGPEDHDIWRRLMTFGCTQKSLPVTSLHLYHDRPEMNDIRHWNLVRYFNSKDPNEIIANNGIIPVCI